MTMPPSLIEQAVQAVGVDGLIKRLTTQEQEALLYDWRAWARPNQLPPPGDWLTWLVQAGRGFGKNRTGSEWVRHRVEHEGARRIGFVGRTPADVRDTMVEGDSGILACYPPSLRPKYESSKRRLTWPNGATALTFTSYEPDQLRGPQFDTLFWDELSAFKYLRETWENGQLALRLGSRPRQIVTTTPKPVTVLKEIIASPSTHVTRGTTYDNLVNLAPTFRQQILSRYEGTARGRQEILGELIDEIPGALWRRHWLRPPPGKMPDMVRIAVGVDPATTSGEESNETGIVVVGKDRDGLGYVLADRSCRASPDAWARRAVTAYHQFKADHIIAESNQGGEMVALTIKTVDKTVPVRLVHASRGKQARAEPVAALFEQGKVFHAESFPDLEDQLCLAGDTLVACVGGQKRLDQIRIGDKVWTRLGPRRVLWAACTSPAAHVMRLTSRNGRHLVTTMGHPVYNPVEQRFYPMEALRLGDPLEELCMVVGDGGHEVLKVRQGGKENMGRKLNGMGGSGALMARMDITAMLRGNCYIGQFGKMPMALFPSMWKFTTKTKTSKIIPWIISASSHVQNTRQYNVGVGLCTPAGSVAHAPRLIGFGGKAENMSAVIAVHPSEAGVCAPDGVQGDVVAKLEMIEGRIPVYNLMVEDAQEFYANGILVHNCSWVPEDGESPDRLDALVWAIWSLMLTPSSEFAVFV